VKPGTRLQFVQLLLPHAPVKDATALANRIRVLADEPGWTAVCLTDGTRREIAFLNPEGARRELATGSAGNLVTDARAGYLDLRGDAVAKVLAVDGSVLTLNGRQLLQSEKRQVLETAGR
jgi:hypothetical protein